MNLRQIFVGTDGTAAILCPVCRKEDVVPAANLIGKHKFKVRCVCQAVFGIQLEFREKYRKETNLEGFLERLSSKERWGKIIWESIETNSQSLNCRIRNISVLGMGLTTTCAHNIKKGDAVRVQFTLDTPASPKIEKKAVVRGVKGNYIGCEFLDTDKYDTKLGFYLL